MPNFTRPVPTQELRKEMDELQARIKELDTTSKRASRLATSLRNHLQVSDKWGW